MLLAIDGITLFPFKRDNNFLLAAIASRLAKLSRIAQRHSPRLAAVRTLSRQRPATIPQETLLLVDDQELLAASVAIHFLTHGFDIFGDCLLLWRLYYGRIKANRLFARSSCQSALHQLHFRLHFFYGRIVLAPAYVDDVRY